MNQSNSKAIEIVVGLIESFLPTSTKFQLFINVKEKPPELGKRDSHYDLKYITFILNVRKYGEKPKITELSISKSLEFIDGVLEICKYLHALNPLVYNFTTIVNFQRSRFI